MDLHAFGLVLTVFLMIFPFPDLILASFLHFYFVFWLIRLYVWFCFSSFAVV